MNTANAAAVKFAQKRPAQYCCISDGIKTGTYETVCVTDSSTLLHIKDTGIYVLAAENHASAAAVTQKLQKPTPIVCLDKVSRDFAISKYGYSGMTDCHLFVYESADPVPFSFDDYIKVLGAKDEETVCKYYDVTPDSETIKRLRAGYMTGAFDKDGNMMGFIGTHEDMSIGMLVVIPEYRRRGVAFALEADMVNRTLSRGLTPFCHVILGNDASVALQNKLGYTKTDENIFWLYED